MIVARARPLYLWISARLSLFFFFLSLSILIDLLMYNSFSFDHCVCEYICSFSILFFLFFTVHHFYVFSSLYVHLLFVSFVFFFFFHRNTFT
jgi:hypothetical protein